MAKKIFILRETRTLSIVEGSAESFGVCIGTDVPSGDVTVALASTNGYFTASANPVFTAVNYLTPQTVTLTGVVTAGVDGFKEDFLTLTCSGGGYTTVKVFRVYITDSGLDYQFLRGWNWYRSIKTKTVGDLATKRATAIARIFNGAGLPAGSTPVDTVSSYTGTMGQTSTGALTGFSSVTRHIWNINHDAYDWPSVTYHIINSSPATAITFVCGGHGSEADHLAMIQDRLDAGNDVIYCFMPCTFENQNRTFLDGSAVSALTLHPGAWAARGVGAHGNYTTVAPIVETVSYSGLNLFFFDKFRAKNYIKANFPSITKFFFTGCSGGGYTAVRMCGMDQEFDAGFDVRGGAKDVYFRAFTDESSAASWDYEQGGVASIGGTINSSNQGIWTAAMDFDVTVFDWLALASDGGRKFQSTAHATDSCCHNKHTYRLWKDYYRDYLLSLGCDYTMNFLTDPAYATHGFQVPDRALVNALFV
jgi:hypothetical protein